MRIESEADMDDDELFDDIPDEDMFLALTQATEAVVATANCAGNGAQPSVTSKAHLPRGRIFGAPSGRAQSSHNKLPRTTAADALKDLPSDAFDSSPETRRTIPTIQRQAPQRPSASRQNFRQTTLWG